MPEALLWFLMFVAAGALVPAALWLESRKDDPW